jgi:hypothetical protein
MLLSNILNVAINDRSSPYSSKLTAEVGLELTHMSPEWEVIGLNLGHEWRIQFALSALVAKFRVNALIESTAVSCPSISSIIIPVDDV